MVNQKVVCFIMPNAANSAEPAERILERFEFLSKKFLETYPLHASKSMFLSSGFKPDSVESDVVGRKLEKHIFSHKKINLLMFFFKSLNLLRRERNKEIMLVAGDNYGALLITLLLKLLISSNIRVQISIHGNPINHGGSKFKNLLRMISFKLLVPRASSVRLVSKHLLFELGDFFGRNAEIIVSPVPVVLPNRFVAKRIGNRVGLIGRLHYERGISLFRDIVTELISQDQNYEFLIVGDGPERPLLSELASRNPKVRIDFLGTLSQIEVQEKLLEIKLLLSCAENEGYGLSIREAILSGTPVIAKENAGTRELRNSFPEMVFLFETIGEAVELIKSEIDSTVNIETVRRYREKQANIDAEGISSLINSWA